MTITGENSPSTTLNELLSHPYDCFILVHPDVHVLEQTSLELHKLAKFELNINKELSNSLITVPVNERGRFLHPWMVDTLSAFHDSPIICTNPDLLFEPSLNIDPFSLFRQIARVKGVVVMWPGEFVNSSLSYAIPEHKHYRSWRITDALLHQPSVLIHRINIY